MKPKNNHVVQCKKLNQKQVHPCVMLSPNLHRNTELKVTLVARPLLTPVAQKLCRCEHGVFTTKRMFILEHYFAPKSSAAVREAFSNAYPDKEVPNKTIHRLVTNFGDTGSVCL
jgi:hypothetical protein